MLLVVNAALMMVLLPGAYALGARRLGGARWALLGWGAVGFVASQIVYRPLLAAWQDATADGTLPGVGPTAGAIGIGVLAALCEEPARAVVLVRAVPERGRGAAWLAGAGHGGIEAALAGAVAMVGSIGVLASAGTTVADFVGQGATPEEARRAAADVAQALAMPWYEALGGAFERALTIPFHVACSLLVVASLRRRSATPFVVAVIAHAALDALALVLVDAAHPVWQLELELAAMALPFVGVVLAWAQRSEPLEADAVR